METVPCSIFLFKEGLGVALCDGDGRAVLLCPVSLFVTWGCGIGWDGLVRPPHLLYQLGSRSGTEGSGTRRPLPDDADDNTCEHLLNTYCVPDAVLMALPVLTFVILIVTYFAHGETEAQ